MTTTIPDTTGWKRHDDTWRGKGFTSFHRPHGSTEPIEEVVYVHLQIADELPHIQTRWRLVFPLIFKWYFESDDETYLWKPGPWLFVKGRPR